MHRLLQSLEERGFVSRDRSLGFHLFSPTLSREAYGGQQRESLAEKLTGGSIAPLLTHLLETDNLDKAEIQRLRKVLEELPLRVFAGPVVGDPVGTNRFGFHILCDMDRDFSKIQNLGGFKPGMADDDDAGGVDDDRLAKPELVDALHDVGNRVVIDTGIVFVRLDSIKRPHFDLHSSVLSKEK